MTIINTSEITFNLPKDQQEYNEFQKRRDESVTWHVEQKNGVIRYKHEQLLFSNE